MKERETFVRFFGLIIQPSQQHIRNERPKQLIVYRIFRRAKQGWDIQILLYPAEKDFNGPTLLVHVGNGFRRRMEEIRHDPNVAAICISKDHYPVTLGRSALFRPQLAREVGLNR